MSIWKYIRQDLPFNKSNTKGKCIIVLFRLAALIARNRVTKVLFSPYLLFYKIIIEWILGIELHWDTRIGPGLRIYHGQATVINKDSRIGSHCIIRQSTTIGNARVDGSCPVIGNYVDIGSNVCIIGDLTIGDNVVIGAGSVVVKSIPPNSLAVGNPARVIKTIV
ncbi:MAG: serine acetyltransferase [Chitinophagaceae bacterium]|nr:serine acetyltransferase [Chitinophagaceae bacterium]